MAHRHVTVSSQTGPPPYCTKKTFWRDVFDDHMPAHASLSSAIKAAIENDPLSHVAFTTPERTSLPRRGKHFAGTHHIMIAIAHAPGQIHFGSAITAVFEYDHHHTWHCVTRDF